MQLISSEKEHRNLPFTESVMQRKLKDMFHPFLMKLAKSAVPFKLVADNDYTPLPGRPILFVGNHYCGNDVIIAANLIHGRVQIVAGKQPLTPVDEFFFNANGTIFVDRKNREDTAACKRAMEALLKQGENVVIFPEGTSNVSDELLMYPMKWGAIEVAQKAGAQIIPMVLHYDTEKKECHVRYCPPMIVDDMEKKEAIDLLRDTMATVRWEFWEQSGIHSRAQMDIAAERAENMRLLLSYKLLDYDYERSVVFHPFPSEEEVWEPICAAYAKMMGWRVVADNTCTVHR